MPCKPKRLNISNFTPYLTLQDASRMVERWRLLLKDVAALAADVEQFLLRGQPGTSPGAGMMGGEGGGRETNHAGVLGSLLRLEVDGVAFLAPRAHLLV